MNDNITISREMALKALESIAETAWYRDIRTQLHAALSADEPDSDPKACVASAPAQPAQEPANEITFDEIESCFPEDGAECDAQTGKVLVSAQWLHDFARAIAATRPAPPVPAAVPPGYALVPIEPFPSQRIAGAVALIKASHSDIDATTDEVAAAYRAMIAAAPPAHAAVPLTDEQIDRIPFDDYGDVDLEDGVALRKFARAIEAAHGIAP